MILNVRKREKVKTGVLRSAGEIPAVLYGKESKEGGFLKGESLLISVNYKDFAHRAENRDLGQIWEIQIEGENKPLNVLLRDVQFNPLTDKYAHVDFYSIDLSKKLALSLPLRFTGQSKAVKNLGGILVKNKDSIEVEALPKDLIPYIEVNLEPLEELGTNITVSDLSFPEKIEVTTNQDVVLISVKAPRSEEELKALDQSIDETSAVEAVKAEKKEEDEEGAEGEEGDATKEKAEEKEKGKEDKK